MKNVFLALLLPVVLSCRNTASSNVSTPNAVSAKKSIDSSVIINESTRLPKDSVVTGVTH